ncbi:MAG: hypothetical protein ACYSUP_12475, partial [Planctomycetota bacterium]
TETQLGKKLTWPPHKVLLESLCVRHRRLSDPARHLEAFPQHDKSVPPNCLKSQTRNESSGQRLPVSRVSFY